MPYFQKISVCVCVCADGGNLKIFLIDQKGINCCRQLFTHTAVSLCSSDFIFRRSSGGGGGRTVIEVEQQDFREVTNETMVQCAVGRKYYTL